MNKLNINDPVILLADGFPRATIVALTDKWCVCKLEDGTELPVTLDRVARAHADSSVSESKSGMTKEKKQELLEKFNAIKKGIEPDPKLDLPDSSQSVEKKGTITTKINGKTQTRSLTEQEIDKTIEEIHKLHDKMWNEFETMRDNFFARLNRWLT